MEVEREAVDAIFLAIEIAHVPAGDVDALRGAEDARESAGQERAEEAIAVGADPGCEGVVVNGEVDFFAEVEEFGGDRDAFVVGDDPVEIGGDLFDEVSNGGFGAEQKSGAGGKIAEELRWGERRAEVMSGVAGDRIFCEIVPVEIEAGHVAEMAAQLCGAAADVGRKRSEERYAHGCGLR